jgi:hypothetical protein
MGLRANMPNIWKVGDKMEKYVINYHTGVTNEVAVSDLDEAKQIAKTGIAYTQEDISIEKDGETVTASTWYGVQPGEEDQVLEMLGGGFYQLWSDELA